MMLRRYTVNADEAIEHARDMRRKFRDEEPRREQPVEWTWPRSMREVGTCEAVMYASDKWRDDRKLIDYKHNREATQYLLVEPGFLRQQRSPSKKLKVVGPSVALDNMPDAFAVLAKILGVQCRLYQGSSRDYYLPRGDEGLYQVDIPGAMLGAARHPDTGGTFLMVYTKSGVHCVITGDELAVEKDGIVG